MENFINDLPEDHMGGKQIEIKPIAKLVPERIRIEYELTNKIEDNSQEDSK